MQTDERPIRFLVFDASLRAGSLNDKLASLATSLVEQRGGAVDRARMVDFDCPSYDDDVEKAEGIPAGAEQLRTRLAEADAFVICAPEYNASLPGVLKNAIDWVSRVRPQPFNAKQGLLMSASPSMVGGNRGLWALRVPLEHLGARVYPDMFSLAQAHQAFDGSGRLANSTLQQRFERELECFMELVEAATRYPTLKKQWVEFLGERPDASIDRVETTSVGGGGVL
jgi:chromate reductase, NAD(P)H dehydrogenase (quinone)